MAESVFHYDCHLDQFIADYDIKEFVTKYLGCTSWEDLDEEAKKACYKNYPKATLPEWTGIVQTKRDQEFQR